MVPKKLKPVLVNELVSKNAKTIDIGLISCKLISAFKKTTLYQVQAKSKIKFSNLLDIL